MPTSQSQSQERPRRSILESMRSKTSSLDIYGESFQMKIEKDKDQQTSLMGTLCSIITAVVLIMYTAQKTDILLNKWDISIQAATSELYFDSDYVFDYSMGLNYAVAFSAFDSEPNPILDPAYGELRFRTYEWGVSDATGEFFVEFKPIPTHTCSREELGLVDGVEGNFFPADSESRSYVDFYQKKFLCVNPEELYIFGDFNSGAARLLQTQLVRCEGHDYCKSEQEITDFFRNKFLMMLTNKVRFNQNTLDDSFTTSESTLGWHKVNSQYQQSLPFVVSVSNLELQDEYVDLDQLTQTESSQPFKLEGLPSQTYEKEKDVQMDITIEMNRDMTAINRSRYTVIDLLSDIGGVQSILMSLIATLVGVWNYQNFDSQMASKLFKIKRVKSSSTPMGNEDGEVQSIEPSMCENLQQLFLDTFLCCCRKIGACRKSKKTRMVETAYERMQEEVNIIDQIKSRRFFHLALKHILPQRKHEELHAKSEYVHIYPSSDQSSRDGEVRITAHNHLHHLQQAQGTAVNSKFQRPERVTLEVGGFSTHRPVIRLDSPEEEGSRRIDLQASVPLAGISDISSDGLYSHLSRGIQRSNAAASTAKAKFHPGALESVVEMQQVSCSRHNLRKEGRLTVPIDDTNESIVSLTDLEQSTVKGQKDQKSDQKFTAESNLWKSHQRQQ